MIRHLGQCKNYAIILFIVVVGGKKRLLFQTDSLLISKWKFLIAVFTYSLRAKELEKISLDSAVESEAKGSHLPLDCYNGKKRGTIVDFPFAKKLPVREEVVQEW